MTARTYVDIPRLYAMGPRRLDVELSFPAGNKRRAVEHKHAALELASLYGLSYSTPFKLNPRWSVYQENWGNGERFGHPDDRRLQVWGPRRAMARYLVALPRVLTAVERLATRAARAFGSWRRSLLTVFSGHLEYEDPTTLAIRAKEFRAEVLTALVGFLRTGVPDAPRRDSSRPLWEQAKAVAAEVWETFGGVDPWHVPEDEVQAQLARVPFTEPAIVEDESANDASATTVPDTVDELLEMAGPAADAPVEEAPEAAAEPVSGAGGDEARWGYEQALAQFNDPLELALLDRADGAPLPKWRRRARSRRWRMAQALGTDAKRWRPPFAPGVGARWLPPLPSLSHDQLARPEIEGIRGLRRPAQPQSPEQVLAGAA
ncbi:hypothetical protein ACIQU6_38460 [Streptomyces sp. NPDC090442]|uniref:hypothetical protein n=1 Tax=Streptomyces sp. NPDC090442 TaxID=3365962 RepID=UPI00380CBFB1